MAKLAFAAIAALMLLSSCGTKVSIQQPAVKTQTATELAVAAIRDDWLKKCEGLPPGPPPENNVGGLLEDYNQVAAVAATCMALQHSLVDYLAPLVAKEKGKTKDDK